VRVRLLTYSTKPRGGVVHALRLAEELTARGVGVELWALSPDGARFFREPRAEVRLVPIEHRPEEAIEERVVRYAEALAGALRRAGPADVHHAEDCLSARALLALRHEGRIAAVVRTVHHVDAFESGFLQECQRASIQDVDHRICVSRFWAERLRAEFGVDSEVVPNGVDAERYAGCPLSRREAGRLLGWGDRPVVLTVGGIEPRKGSRTLLEAFARARGRLGAGALLAIAGGHTLFDYREYRAGWWDDLHRLGLRAHEGRGVPEGADVAILGTIPDEEMPVLYRAADVLAFPSTREGFGLVVLEALASGLPVVTSDLAVFREHLSAGRDCLMAPVGDSGSLAEALVQAARDEDLRARLRAAGAATARSFSWARTAAAHEQLYGRLDGARG
jgi:glycosyltransferase-like protein